MLEQSVLLKNEAPGLESAGVACSTRQEVTHVTHGRRMGVGCCSRGKGGDTVVESAGLTASGRRSLRLVSVVAMALELRVEIWTAGKTMKRTLVRQW